jgi:hypothetical protein
MGSFDWDTRSKSLHIDDAGLAMLDLLPEEYDTRLISLAPRLSAEVCEWLDSTLESAMRDGRTSYSAHFEITCRAGERRWAHLGGRILRNDQEKPYRVVGIISDATTMRSDVGRGLTAAIQRTAEALSTALTVADVVSVLTGTDGLERFGADGLVLGLVEGDVLNLVELSGDSMDLLEELQSRRLDTTTPLAEAVLTRKARFFASQAEGLAVFPRMRPYVERLSSNAAAFLPLIAQARTIGGLALVYREPVSFSPEDRDLCMGMAGIVAQSLQRAILFEQERDFATGLQASMLPRRVPEFDGTDIAVRYHAASSGRAVGGDWYDVIALPGGRVGLVVGDVQGHDTHAAAIMGQLRIALRAFAGEGHAPSVVLERASGFLAELDTERFATCTYAELDPATGEVRAARAGHLGPLVRSRANRVGKPYLRGGLPLGLATDFGRELFPETRIALAPGETLVLCTDGLVEEPGADISVGFGALADAVRTGPVEAGALADHLAERLSRRWGTDDDVALLILRRTLCDE